jgi:hypothetical protein
VLVTDPPYGQQAITRTPSRRVMETLIAACPAGVIADPFAGSGSTLIAARNLGRKASGWSSRSATRGHRSRLAQDCLDFGETA